MSSPQTLSKPVTIEDVLADPPRDRHWEIVRGKLVVQMPPGERHGEIVVTLAIYIGQYVRKHRLGRVVGGESGFILERDPDTLRTPDLAFTGQARAGEVTKGFREGPPDLAVEVVSPNDRRSAVLEKANHWLGHGTRLVWVVWPESREVTEHRPGRGPRTWGAEDSLDGAEVLPGFSERVGAIFA